MCRGRSDPWWCPLFPLQWPGTLGWLDPRWNGPLLISGGQACGERSDPWRRAPPPSSVARHAGATRSTMVTLSPPSPMVGHTLEVAGSAAERPPPPSLAARHTGLANPAAARSLPPSPLAWRAGVSHIYDGGTWALGL